MFKQRTHKNFNYKPRFSKENHKESSLSDDSDSKDFVSKWKQSKSTKVTSRGAISMKILILILMLLLICMYLLETKFV